MYILARQLAWKLDETRTLHFASSFGFERINKIDRFTPEIPRDIVVIRSILTVVKRVQRWRAS